MVYSYHMHLCHLQDSPLGFQTKCYFQAQCQSRSWYHLLFILYHLNDIPSCVPLTISILLVQCPYAMIPPFRNYHQMPHEIEGLCVQFVDSELMLHSMNAVLIVQGKHQHESVHPNEADYCGPEELHWEWILGNQMHDYPSNWMSFLRCWVDPKLRIHLYPAYVYSLYPLLLILHMATMIEL